MSLTNDIANAIHRDFSAYSALLLGVPLELGDFGVLEGSGGLKHNLFKRTGSLAEVDIQFKQRPDSTADVIDYQSSKSVKLEFKAAGQVSNTSLPQAKAGFHVALSSAHAFAIEAVGVRNPIIEDLAAVGEKVLALYKANKWDKKRVIVTGITVADCATVLAAAGEHATIDISGDVSEDRLTLARASASLHVEAHSGVEVKMLAQQGLVLMVTVMGVRDGLFTKPKFVPRMLALRAGSEESARAQLEKRFAPVASDRDLHFGEPVADE